MKITPTLGGAYSGSFGGMTASRNAGGQYFRRRAVPVNPNTARQQTVRSVLGGLVNTWSDDLTDAQRQSWRDYGQNTPTTDSLGQVIRLSGINQFIRTNSPLQQATNAGLILFSTIDDAPVVFNTGEPVESVPTFSGVFTVPPGTVDLTLNLAGAAPAAGNVLVYIAPPQTPGTRFFKGPYQLATAIVFAAAATQAVGTVIDLATAWASDTVPVAAWDTLHIPLRAVVSYNDGRRSQVFRALVPFSDATP